MAHGSDDLFSYDRLTALVFKGELALLGLAVSSSCAASFSVLLKCTWKVSAPRPESPSGWGVVKVVWELATTSVLTLQLVV